MGRHPRTTSAFLAMGASALALSACSAASIDTDNSGGIALVEEFFAHLEAGEAQQAAALTSMDFGDQFIDDDFYRASSALPSDARIVETTGYDSGGFRAVVSFVTDDPNIPVTLEMRVAHNDGDLTITGWTGDSPIRLTSNNLPGTLTINGTLEYASTNASVLTLLPAAYRAEYDDPTQLTHLLGQDSSFVANIPNVVEGPRFNASPALLPDVDDGVLSAIEELQAACADEGFVGPLCPDELIENIGTALDSSVTAEWFREPGAVIEYVDGEFIATNAYKVALSNWDPYDTITVTYSGVVTRDADGVITLTL